MGIQCTRQVTRRQAEALYVERHREAAERRLRAEAVLLDNQALEKAIEEHFYNYDIVAEGEEDR